MVVALGHENETNVTELGSQMEGWQGKAEGKWLLLHAIIYGDTHTVKWDEFGQSHLFETYYWNNTNQYSFPERSLYERLAGKTILEEIATRVEGDSEEEGTGSEVPEASLIETKIIRYTVS